MSYDISSIQVADTFDVELVHPKTSAPMLGDEGKPCTVTVYGPGSKAYAAAKAKNNLRFVERLKRKGKQEADPEEDAANTAAFLAACTVSFNNFGYKGMPSGPDAFRALYLDPKMGFITEQVNGEMGDWANFTTSSSKTS